MNRINLRRAAVTCFRNTLNAYGPYEVKLRWTGGSVGLTRTYGENVPADSPLPYVTIEWYGGGKDNDTRTDAAMTYWKVAGHTKEDPKLSEEIDDLIFAALDYKMPIAPASAYYNGYAPILLKYPYTDTVFRSGVTLQRSGGIYSLCLAETKE